MLDVAEPHEGRRQKPPQDPAIAAITIAATRRSRQGATSSDRVDEDEARAWRRCRTEWPRPGRCWECRGRRGDDTTPPSHSRRPAEHDASRKVAVDEAPNASTKPLRPLRQHVEEQGQPEVLVAVDGDGGAQHREPEEADRGDLVDPDDREGEDVAGYDAREQQDDDRQQKKRRNHLERPDQQGTDAMSPTTSSASGSGAIVSLTAAMLLSLSQFTLPRSRAAYGSGTTGLQIPRGTSHSDWASERMPPLGGLRGLIRVPSAFIVRPSRFFAAMQ